MTVALLWDMSCDILETRSTTSSGSVTTIDSYRGLLFWTLSFKADSPAQFLQGTSLLLNKRARNLG